MTKLHELIAVEPDLKDRANKEKNSLTSILSHGQNFVGEVRTYQPLEELGETFPNETTNINYTAKEVVEGFSDVFGNWIDVALQKEISNTLTSADVVVNGEVIFSGLPSPALLNLESKLAEIRNFYNALPVLDMTETWHYDQNNLVWVSEPRKTFKTKKVFRNHVKAEATKEHPAQVDIFTEDARIGEWTKIVKSSSVTARQKKLMLDRIDALLLAVKKARQLANDIDAKTPKISSVLFDYINQGVF